MVLQMAGKCSFCGRDRREVFGIAGIVGREQRICDECIGLCFDILAEEMKDQAKDRFEVAHAGAGASWTDDELEKLLRAASSDSGVDPRDLIGQIQARLESPSERKQVAYRDFHCSFCDRSRQDVRKLISGPRVFICDDCAGDAGGLLAASGWRVSLHG